MNVFFLIGGFMFLGFGTGFFFLGFRYLRTKRMIENLPRSKCRSVAMGLAELKGEVVAAEKLLVSPFSQKQCVYYDLTVEEYGERKVQGRDGQEETQSEWEKVGQGSESVPFYLKDETGKVLVNPVGADIEAEESYSAQSGPGIDPPKAVVDYMTQYHAAMMGEIRNKVPKVIGKLATLAGAGTFSYKLSGINKQMIFKEHAILPGQVLYVIGEAKDNPNVAAGAALKSEENVMIGKGLFFVISTSEEKHVGRGYGWRALAVIVFGVVAFVVSLSFFFKS
jgi:hypothetical protein